MTNVFERGREETILKLTTWKVTTPFPPYPTQKLKIKIESPLLMFKIFRIVCLQHNYWPKSQHTSIYNEILYVDCESGHSIWYVPERQ